MGKDVFALNCMGLYGKVSIIGKEPGMGLEPSAILGKRQNKHKRELWIQRFPTVIVLEDVSIFVPHCAPEFIFIHGPQHSTLIRPIS